MDIGNPLIYTCPSCGKKMKMTTFTSYTVSSSKSYSDGYVKESGICCAHSTPELAKCPYCKNLFLRHKVKDAEYVNFYTNKVKKDIEEPNTNDIIKAVKNKIFKKWQDEKELRQALWLSLNDDTRDGYNQLSGDDLKLWQENCAVLLQLIEKTLNKTQSGKNSKKDGENCLLVIAELNRNLGKFDKCMDYINQLDGKQSWLKKQFAWECKGKNIFTFEIIPKDVMNLEKSKDQNKDDYYNRAKYFLPPYYGRRNIKKIIADYDKAESLGMKGTIFYCERGDLYLNELNDTDSAIAYYTKALKQNDDYRRSYSLSLRSNAYFKKGNLKKALADINAAIKDNSESYSLYTSRAEIYEALGNTDEAENNRGKAKELEQVYNEQLQMLNMLTIK